MLDGEFAAVPLAAADDQSLRQRAELTSRGVDHAESTVDLRGREAGNLGVGIDLADLGMDDVVERLDQLLPAVDVVEEVRIASGEMLEAEPPGEGEGLLG